MERGSGSKQEARTAADGAAKHEGRRRSDLPREAGRRSRIVGERDLSTYAEVAAFNSFAGTRKEQFGRAKSSPESPETAAFHVTSRSIRAPRSPDGGAGTDQRLVANEL